MKLTSDNTASPEVDPFNAPIPGQSLTDEPGNYPWEHPPKHDDPEKLLDVLWNRLTQKEAIVRVLVFTGFAEGEYNPDVGFMIVEPLMEMVTAIGIKAGIKNLKITLKDISNKKFKKTMAQLKVANKETENNNGPMMPAEEALPSPALGGLLSKPQESE